MMTFLRILQNTKSTFFVCRHEHYGSPAYNNGNRIMDMATRCVSDEDPVECYTGVDKSMCMSPDAKCID